VNLIPIAVAAAAGIAIATLAAGPVYRLSVPAGSEPRRACRHCGAGLRAGWSYWLLFPSRCRTCRRTLVPRWWIYQTTAGLTFAALSWRLPAQTAPEAALLLAWLLLATAGIVLAGIDVNARRLPTSIISTTALAIGGLIAVAACSGHRPLLAGRAALAAFALGSTYLAIALARTGSVGLGDVRLAALLGLILGSAGTMAVALGAILPYLLAAPASVVALLRRRDRQIPFGPYLITGAILAVLFTGLEML